MRKSLLSLFACGFALTNAHGAVLFSDVFEDNTTSGSEDVNVDLAGGRQTGTTVGSGTVSYVQGNGTWGTISGSIANEASNGFQTQVDNSGTADALWLVSQGGNQIASVSPDYNFDSSITVGNYMSISVELDPSDNAGWGAISIGSSDNASFGSAGSGARGQFINDSAAHFGFLLTNSGDWQAFNGGTQITTGNQSYSGSFATIELRFSGVGGAAYNWDGSDADIQVFVDGASVFNQTVAGGFTDNYISLLGYAESFEIHQFDDLQVQVVPEPNTFATLLGGIGLLAMFRRNRARRTS